MDSGERTSVEPGAPGVPSTIGPGDVRRAAILGLAAFLVLASGCLWGVPNGKSHVGGLRVLDGEIPYRDFWTMYAPGEFYATALALAVSGRQLVAPGVLSAAVWGAASALFYLLARRFHTGAGVALVLGAAFALMRWSTAIALGTYPPALLLGLLALHAFTGWLDTRERRRLVHAGLWCGAAAVFKHDVAAYVAAGIAMAVLVAERGRLRGALALATGALAVVLPAAVLVGALAGRDAFEDLVVFPLRDFAGVRAEAFPPLAPDLAALRTWLAGPPSLGKARSLALELEAWILCRVPEAVFAAGLAVVLARWKRIAPRARTLAVLCLALLPFFWLAAHVQRNTHLHSMAAFAMLLGALAWTAGRRTTRIALAAAALVQAVGLVVEPGLSMAAMLRRLASAERLDLPGTALVHVSPEDRAVYHPIVSFVRAHVPEDEPIYVGLGRHDATVISNPSFYFLAGRRPCTRYHELHPGVSDREDAEREIIASIDSDGVRCAILWDFGWPAEQLDRIRERNRAAVPGAGSDVLDLWLAEHFETVERHGEYRVLWRKDADRR